MKMKINTQNFFEQTIAGVNRLQNKIEKERGYIQDKDEGIDALNEIEELLGREFGTIDIALKIMASWINDIADRAFELGDEKLITALAGLCITQEEQTKKKEG